ncbi:MAG: hypothetical protein KJ994_01825 [Candidatus Omnitrophica bacterium]|nr:hypothetical protein [Candidatus Omnitrophota bacterium]
MILRHDRGMELNLRNAVILSLVIHAAIVISLYYTPVLRVARIEHKEIVVDFVASVEPKKIEITRQETKAISVDTPKVNLTQKIDMKPVFAGASSEINDEQQKEISDELAAKQARIKSTHDYINYYQLIREKIRRSLKSRYRSYYGEGDVSLIFSLRSDGSLISSAVDPVASISDDTLVDTAIRSLKDAAPFARFPKTLTLPQMSFTVTVSFKKQ